MMAWVMATSSASAGASWVIVRSSQRGLRCVVFNQQYPGDGVHQNWSDIAAAMVERTQ